MWDLNVKSSFFLIKECYEMLVKSKENKGAANILVISSVAGRDPSHSIGVYGSTKAALDNMVKFLCKELMVDGIRINSLCPGLIRTAFSGPLTEVDGIDPAAIGTPDNIGSVAALISSPLDGAFMNGEIYYVHGGFAKM